MAKISVAEAAAHLGVNVQRVHQRIADGSLPAERVGHQWAINEADLARLDRRPAGRPLSPKSAWVLARMAAFAAAESAAPHAAAPVAQADAAAALAQPDIAPSERSRARSRLREFLSDAPQPQGRRDDESAAADLAAHLRSLLRSRAERRLFHSSPRDLDDLRSDHRISLSGISLPDSGIASGDIVEGYVSDHHLNDLVDDFLLSDARHGEANVVLHVVDAAAAPDWRVESNNWLLLAADLAEHHRPREIARAAQIVREVADQYAVLRARGSR
jgi:excisionase family DNA binding protein